MITEDYVSFEVAKLLKEKGFDIQGYASIKVFGGNTYKVNGEWITPKEDTIIPTLQMAMKWLREVHNIQVVVSPYNTLDKTWSYHMFRNFEALTQRFYIFKTYEESCEAAIKYCLENLI